MRDFKRRALESLLYFESDIEAARRMAKEQTFSANWASTISAFCNTISGCSLASQEANDGVQGCCLSWVSSMTVGGGIFNAVRA